jgi:hypothetical protein
MSSTRSVLFVYLIQGKFKEFYMHLSSIRSAYLIDAVKLRWWLWGFLFIVDKKFVYTLK